MDCNKDESERCIDIATQSAAEGNHDKAIRFLLKAEKLYPSSKAKKLLEELRSIPNGSCQNPKTRRHHNSAKKEGSSNAEYTSEELHHVQRIVRRCKDYYGILSVTKEATDSEIKKSYKKLALQLHPDKNKAPGAAEAFKAISNAVAILTDVEKRKQYDLYSSNDERDSFQKHQHSQKYTRGFEEIVEGMRLAKRYLKSGKHAIMFLGRVVVYIDGACLGHDSEKRAGYGVWFNYNHYWNSCGHLSHDVNCTNQNAEIEAAIQAVNICASHGRRFIEIRIHSAFLVKSLEYNNFQKWKSNGWCRADGSQLKNMDKWVELDRAIKDNNMKILWTHVPRHQGNEGNEEAEKLAKEGTNYY